jgi:anti-anti-sigma factor
MADFNLNVQDGVARLTLSGKLDTAVAPQLSEQLKTLVGKGITRVLFMAGTLDYISSAGLRAIVFAKQKIGAGVQVFVIGAKPEVIDIIKMTGFDSFVVLQDSYKA